MCRRRRRRRRQVLLADKQRDNEEARLALIRKCHTHYTKRAYDWEMAVEDEVRRLDVVKSVAQALVRGIRDQAPDFNKHKHEVCVTAACGVAQWVPRDMHSPWL